MERFSFHAQRFLFNIFVYFTSSFPRTANSLAIQITAHRPGTLKNFKQFSIC
jgi:hypothetical protein